MTLPDLPSAGAQRAFPSFRAQDIDTNLKIGYAVTVAEMNADGKPDVVVVDKEEIAWYENPTWTKRVIVAAGQTPLDNVCIAAADLDGDRRAELALGAFWKPADTLKSGSVHWLARAGDPAQPWKVVNLEAEPTVHRMRWADTDGDGRQELIVAPLHGRGNRTPDFEGEGVKIQAYLPPARPAEQPWRRETIDSSMHVVHNLWSLQWDGDRAEEILTASFEGVHLLDRGADGSWKKTQLAAGDQQTRPNRGSSEIKAGRLPGGERYLATVEPFHGNAFVVYTAPRAGDAFGNGSGPLWVRKQIDSGFLGGHALWCVDLDADGADELVAGWRDATPARKPGLRIFRPQRSAASDWPHVTLDDGGMACEDVTAADLNGDSRPDIIAAGRATRNLRIYWNGG